MIGCFSTLSKERAEFLAKTIRWTTETEGFQFQRVFGFKALLSCCSPDQSIAHEQGGFVAD